LDIYDYWYSFTPSNENAMTVNHPSFGKGQVISQDEKNITIDFNGDIKTMVTRYAKLTNEDGTPFGEQAIATPKKNTSNKNKMYKFEQTLTEEQKKKLSFENSDGSFNQQAYDKAIEKIEQNKKASRSW
jgi:hypothetical protein